MVAAASSKLCRSGRPYRKLLTDDDDDVAAAIVFLFLCFVSLVSLMLFRPFFPALLHVCCVRLANVFLPGQLSSRSRVSRTFLLLRALFSSESLRVPEMRIQLHVSQELFLLSPQSSVLCFLPSLESVLLQALPFRCSSCSFIAYYFVTFLPDCLPILFRSAFINFCSKSPWHCCSSRHQIALIHCRSRF